MLVVNSISKHIDTDLIFENVSFSISKGDKIALIGRNGVGKTTLLNILTGKELPDLSDKKLSDKIKKPNNFSIATLSQERFKSKQKVFDFVYGENKQKIFWKKKIFELKEILEKNYSEKLMNELIESETELAKNSDEIYESKIEKIFELVGISEKIWFSEIDSLSGGEFNKVSFAKILAESHDLILLDEPTNHMDLPTKKWLTEVIKKIPEAVLVVSHDRTLLKNFPQKIFELKKNGLEIFSGNYDSYLIQRKQKDELLKKNFENFEREKKHLEEQIERFWDWQMRTGGDNEVASKKRKTTEMKLEKLLENAPINPNKIQKLNLQKSSTDRTGNFVLKVSNLNIRIKNQERFLVKNFNLEIWPNEKVFLKAPNGRGKTTILNIIFFEEISKRSKLNQNFREKFKEDLKRFEKKLENIEWNGEIKFSETISIEFFEQGVELETNEKLSDFVENLMIGAPNEKKFKLLRQYEFSKEDLIKKVSSLSGGQKTKLKLMKILLTNSNFLILDEPTNHLDLLSIEELEEFCKKFSGSILAVSHDDEFEKIGKSIEL
ncbi:MAG: ABC-F family ATP-binding cassette domain-containing protein [Patescibacteria group bacterium]